MRVHNFHFLQLGAGFVVIDITEDEQSDSLLKDGVEEGIANHFRGESVVEEDLLCDGELGVLVLVCGGESGVDHGLDVVLGELG